MMLCRKSDSIFGTYIYVITSSEVVCSVGSGYPSELQSPKASIQHLSNTGSNYMLQTIKNNTMYFSSTLYLHGAEMKEA